jgi:glyoxylase-like metal-dependent hydrolase (beta-lactamase superfamily II)
VACDLQALRVVTLSERVRRITCDNGSVMTGPGTNTYLIGAPGSDEVAVLDPGPLDGQTEAHLQAVLAAAGPARITRIFVTHTHQDHSPAVQRLHALTGAQRIGRVARYPDRQDLHFIPDRVPEDGERWVLGPGCTLRAVATPGHASNHLCWLLEEERLLFTGDHVMQGSTVVINPPDGEMAAYLASLRGLMDLPLDWLAPGHGFLMAQPRQVLEGLVAHRLAREAKVLAALQKMAATLPQPVEQLLPEVYGDVPTARHGVALRSLLAHLHHLAEQGLAGQAGLAGHWQPVPAS